MDFSQKEKALYFLNRQAKVINNTRSLKNKLLNKNKKVTIIVPVFNGENYIQKCIDSVVNQTIGFKNIELVVIDDNSSDSTKEILTKNLKKHKFTVVFLKQNSGKASTPRNIGIELATTEYMMFLDSDDWLHPNAIKTLIKTVDKEKSDFIVGKTIKVTDNGMTAHAEFVSYKNRFNVSPFNIPYLFYHMGPQSKIIRSSIILENNLRFPEMKFGEDKIFFLNVLLKCNNVTTLNEPICYINRLSDNNSSITKTVDVLKKRDADIQFLKEILDKRLEIDKEKLLTKRVIEYDLTKSCDSFTFVKSKNQQKFMQYIKEGLSLVKNKPYNILEEFDSPLYQEGAELIQQEKYNEFQKLFIWYKCDKNKHVCIKDNIAYYKVPPYIENISNNNLIAIPLFARAKNSYVENNKYIQTVEIYGDKIDTVKNVLIRDKHNLNNEIELPIAIQDNLGIFEVDYSNLNVLNNSLFGIYIRFDGHKLVNIKRILENRVSYEKRTFSFYTTKASNLGLSIKNM